MNTENKIMISEGELNDVCTTAMFICEGLHNAGYSKVIKSAAGCTDQGWQEIMTQISKFAILINSLVAKYHELEFDYPGVFDYEVAAPFGRWYGEFVIENVQLPTDEAASEYAKYLTKKFFCQP